MNYTKEITPYLVYLFALLHFSSCTNPIISEDESGEFFLGGIQINEPDQDAWCKQLKASKMNTVEVTVYAKQGNWDSDHLWWEEEEPGVMNEIKTARENGLKIILILRVALDHAFEENKFLWHGMIIPKNDTLLKSWFNQYRQFVTKWAIIAEKEKIDLLVIGSEMKSLSATLPIDSLPPLESYYLNKSSRPKYEETVLSFNDTLHPYFSLKFQEDDHYHKVETYLIDETKKFRDWANIMTFNQSTGHLFKINNRRKELNEEWKILIKETRHIYSGQLSYAANFDNFYQVGFWKNLDFIGINAYFSLRDSLIENPSSEYLYSSTYKGWTTVFDRIKQFKSQENISSPILFTELGFTRRENSSLFPWAINGFSIIDEGKDNKIIIWEKQKSSSLERIISLKSLHDALLQKGLKDSLDLRGILYWKLTTQEYHLPYEPYGLLIESPQRDSLLFWLQKISSL